MLLVAMLAPVTVLASPPSNAFRFLHDPDGRIKAAIDPEGSTAEYDWDEAGNLLAISRHASSELSIVQLSPAKGEVGATVVIEGTGFSATPASNTVKFNGTAATVSAASATSLTVKVPGGATTGSVTVSTSEEGPATSPAAFTVVESSAPHISSISPSVAVAGEEITIAGSNFEPAIPSNSLTVNQVRPEMTSAASSTIKFKVPSGTLGGHVSVATPTGSSTGPDLFIPPSGTTTSKVGWTGRFSLGESKTAEFAGSEKVALLLFDGTAGHRVLLSLAEATISGTVSIWSPAGSKIASASFTKGVAGFLEETEPLPTTGTYTVLLTPSGSGAGTVKVTSSDFPGSTGSITPAATAEGTTQHVAISQAGQAARYTIAMSAGEKVAMKTNNSNFTASYVIKWFKPNGEIFSSTNFEAKENWFWNTQTFTTAGTYTVVLDPNGSATGSVDLQFWEDPDITGQTVSPSSEGASVTSTIKVPGQRELITFSGTKEESFSWKPTESSYGSNGSITLLRPNGTSLASGGTAEGFHNPVSLPEAGTYTLVVDPSGTATGSVKLTAYEVTGNPIKPAATAEGTTQHVATSFAGQAFHYAITMSAGEKVAMRTKNSNFTAGYVIKWIKPDGSTFSSTNFEAKENWFWEPQTFATAGTYTVVLDPNGSATGSVDLQFWEDVDITGHTVTPSIEGGSVTSKIEVPGQRELITFSGTKEESFSWKPTESTFSSGTITLLRPNGSSLGSGSFTAGFHSPVSLPESGTYTFVVDPAGSSTGSLKLTAYEVTGNSIKPAATAEGTTQHVATSFAGQAFHYAITMSAGEKVAMRTNNSNFTAGYTITWFKPNGEEFSHENFGAKENWFWNPQTFATAGTYTVVLDPNGSATGSVDLQFWEDVDVTGHTVTPSIEGGSFTSKVEVPGQRELITFSGTKEESVSWKPTESAISGTITLLRPSGSSLASSTFSEGFHNPVILPEAGTYTFLVDPGGAATGSVKLTAYEVTGNPVTPAATAEGTTQHVETSFAGQTPHYAVTMSAARRSP